MCTGSGCIALALAEEFPDFGVCGTDISGTAIKYADINADINGIRNAAFLEGPLFQPVEEMFEICCSNFEFDFIISNPPYVKSGDIQSLQPEVREWEPRSALDGGTDGLDFYRELIPEARRFLRDGGLVMLELGEGQLNDVADVLGSSGYVQVECIKDYAGIERIITAKCRK